MRDSVEERRGSIAPNGQNTGQNVCAITVMLIGFCLWLGDSVPDYY
jgi:hypothetical protein